MKKAITLMIALIMVVSLSACGKSQLVIDVEEMIDSIGVVSLESGETIEKAEKMFAVLSEKEKSSVENRIDLVNARDKYNNLVAEEAAEQARIEEEEKAAKEREEKEAQHQADVELYEKLSKASVEAQKMITAFQESVTDDLAFVSKYAGNVNGAGKRAFADSFLKRMEKAFDGIDVSIIREGDPILADLASEIMHNQLTVVALLYDMGATNSDKNVPTIKSTASATIKLIQDYLDEAVVFATEIEELEDRLKSDDFSFPVEQSEESEEETGKQVVAIAIAGGENHLLTLFSDGTVRKWGASRTGTVWDWRNIVAVAAGNEHSVALKQDGTVIADGVNSSGQCDVGEWKDIIAIAAGYQHTVGLRSDGTVVAVGSNDYGQCNVSDWTDIIQINAYWLTTVGLKADGTVVAVGSNDYGQCDVSEWTGIKEVAAGGYHTLGLKEDGTVVSVGYNDNGQCNTANWTGIKHICAGHFHSLGLKNDGTVVAVGDNEYGQCDVSTWTNIQDITCYYTYSAGLKPDKDNEVIIAGDYDY